MILMEKGGKRMKKQWKKQWKRQWKKSMALLMAGGMLLSATGCGESGSTKTTVTDTSSASGTKKEWSNADAITWDVYDLYANYQGEMTGWYAEAVRDRFNVTLNLIAPNVAGDGNALYQTRAAAGNMGDIVFLSNDQMKDCIDAGLILDISEYVKDKENLAKFQVGADALSDYFGTDSTYAYPIHGSTGSPTEPNLRENMITNALYLRFDYYEELGCPEIKDENDLLDVFEQMRDLHPTIEDGDKTYAFSLWSEWDSGEMCMAEMLCRALYGTYNINTAVMTNYDCTVAEPLNQKGGSYYKALKFFYECNQRGLLDPDSATQNYSTTDSKVRKGSSLCILYSWQKLFNTLEVQNQGKGYAFVPVDNQLIYVDGKTPYGDGGCVAVGANCKDPERAVAFLDWYASSESMNLNAMNIEGLTYEVGEDGLNVLTEYGKDCYNLDSEVPEEYGGGKINTNQNVMFAYIGVLTDTDPNTGEMYLHDGWSSTIQDSQTKLTEDWTAVYGVDNGVEYAEQNGSLQVGVGYNYILPVENTEASNRRNQCNKIVEEYSWRMVYAADDAEFDSFWNEMCTQLAGYEYDQVIEADMDILNEIKAARQETMDAVAEQN